MNFSYKNNKKGSELRLVLEEAHFDRIFYGKDLKDKLLTIAWNRGPAQQVTIDGVAYTFGEHTILPLMVNQSFEFASPADITAWQFNREFYCIVDHDKEVSCAGFLFYGSAEQLFIALDQKDEEKLALLLRVFLDEFETDDNIQGDMLQMLLKRLIIILTRLARGQFVTGQPLTEDKMDIVRKYNMLVENHYKKEHRVSFYAEKLHRSPKTLANLFAIYNRKSPLMVIRERVLLESKRLLMYTDKSAKEIAYELGFEDAAYFSKFFKQNAGQSPSDFRNSKDPLTRN
ncbi:helix-turn-helix domain-containing protein [Chitinophaga sp. GCM10012297]|uniref:Helix-turn-helix domain-containing protein n=1 Tax=Chitinophaga chungangae TaxID=2821488 RepID=A0ABS3YEU1_9BACT|nr:AraC family transcriptional regulator [Chitinophaga chungangae]MBO9152813.1 helix-turn-helix domain-containing protein [Chitinophaga chungangae]